MPWISVNKLKKEFKRLPYISIQKGSLVVERLGRKVLKFPANNKGAIALGKKLKKSGAKTWLYASSVDFPEENGGEDLDLRAIIMDTVEGV